jgi:hypothetical protein
LRRWGELSTAVLSTITFSVLDIRDCFNPYLNNSETRGFAQQRAKVPTAPKMWLQNFVPIGALHTLFFKKKRQFFTENWQK